MKRVLSVFIILLILLTLVPDKKTHAAAAPVLRIVGSTAQKIFAANGAKAGIKYGGKNASEEAVKRWNMDFYNDHSVIDISQKERYEKYMEAVNNANVIPYPEGHEKHGWGKTVLNAALFVTGGDIAYEIWQQAKDSADHQKAMELMETTVYPENVYDSVFGIRGVPPDPDKATMSYWDIVDSSGKSLHQQGTNSTFFSFPIKISYEDIDSTRVSIVSHVTWKYGDNEVMRYSFTMYKSDFNSNKATTDFATSSGIMTNPSPLEIPAPIAPYVTDPVANPDITPLEEAYPDGIEIDIPLTDEVTQNNPDPATWNDPLPDVLPNPNPEPLPEPEPEPEPGTEEPPPGDGTGEEPPTKDPGKNPFKDIIPVAILLALLDLLISIIFYLIRMLEFILTIPMIPAKSFGNPAFEWFKTAKIMGVYIYQVVMSMGTIGLSFLVYKAIRRVMP